MRAYYFRCEGFLYVAEYYAEDGRYYNVYPSSRHCEWTPEFLLEENRDIIRNLILLENERVYSKLESLLNITTKKDGE